VGSNVLSQFLLRRRRLIATAVAVPFLVGLAIYSTYWWVLYRRAAEAEAEYRHAWASYQAGLATKEDVCIASRAACLAALRVPLSDSVRTYAIHLARVQHMEILARHYLAEGEWGQGGEEGRDHAIRDLAAVNSYATEAEHWFDSVFP
jgi:hypothetical protein